MDITRDNLLALIQNGIKRKALSISALEKNSGVPKDTIRDFLRGKTQILRADKLQKILRILEPSKKVPVVGYVSAAAEIFSIDDHAHGAGLDEVDCPPGVDAAHVVAVRVRGDSMFPVFHDGWIVYYSERRDIIIPPIRGGWQVPYNKTAKKTASKQASEVSDLLSDFFGKPCVVKLKDGRMMLKTLKRGDNPGYYNLISYNADDIKNAELEWAAKIIFIKTD
jgi:predicted XRE-type DNA-binding protein